MSEVDDALSIGEVAWALHVSNAAVRAAKKSGPAALLHALRRHATIELAYADDTDMPSLTRAARAWRKVVEADGATPADFAWLAWAELLASAPKKAQAAAKDAEVSTVLEAALAWAARRKDAKRLAAFADAATATQDDEQRELGVRLLAQASVGPLALADRLVERQEPPWDPAVARRVALAVGVYRAAGERERAEGIASAWARACERALPDPRDPRRHVLDAAGAPLEGAQRRVERVTARYGLTHPALETPLRLLAFQARHEAQHETAVEALRRLEPILATKGTSQDDLLELHVALGDLRTSLVALRRFDEAFAVLEREEAVKARRVHHLVPDHPARASIYEALGDMDRAIEEYLATVAQYEAGPPPIYGPDAPNTELARGWARRALERAGRSDEAERLVSHRARS